MSRPISARASRLPNRAEGQGWRIDLGSEYGTWRNREGIDWLAEFRGGGSRTWSFGQATAPRCGLAWLLIRRKHATSQGIAIPSQARSGVVINYALTEQKNVLLSQSVWWLGTHLFSCCIVVLFTLECLDMQKHAIEQYVRHMLVLNPRTAERLKLSA